MQLISSVDLICSSKLNLMISINIHYIIHISLLRLVINNYLLSRMKIKTDNNPKKLICQTSPLKRNSLFNSLRENSPKRNSSTNSANRPARIFTKQRSITQQKYRSPIPTSSYTKINRKNSFAKQLLTKSHRSVSEYKQRKYQQKPQKWGGIEAKSAFVNKQQTMIEQQLKSLRKLEYIRHSTELSTKNALTPNSIRYKSSKLQINQKIGKQPIKLKSIALPDYMQFIKSRQNQAYVIGFDFSYLKNLPREKAQAVVDFTHFKVMQSIQLCALDILNEKNNGETGHILLMEYSLLYFRLFEKNMLEAVLLYHFFKIGHQTLLFFLRICRLFFAVMYELSFMGIVFKFKNPLDQTLRRIIKIQRIFYKGHIDICKQRNYISQTLKLLRATNQIERQTLEMIPYIKEIIKETQSIGRVKNILRRLSLTEDFFCFDNFQLEWLVQAEVTLAWTFFRIPPIPHLPPARRKYTLVIGIQNVLIYCKGQREQIRCRPFHQLFLQRMKEHFELVAFSNQFKATSDTTIDFIQKSGLYFNFRLYKQHLSFKDGIMVKDLSKLGRESERTILVDQSVKGKGCISIKFYKGEKNDNALLSLADRLLDAARGEPNDINEVLACGDLQNIEQELEEETINSKI